MTVPEACRAAALLLRREGWTKGTMKDNQTGCRCIVGALWSVTPVGEDVDVEALIALRREAGLGHIPWTEAKGSLTVWNDATDRTLDQVLDLLDRTARKHEAAL